MERAQVNFRSRVRLVDEVAEELRERIYAGDYPLGTKLHQEQLAEDLQISRTPLREALRVLESEGLLHSEPGRGVRVVPADINKVSAAYQLREVLDGLAARLAAESRDADARAALADSLIDQRAALDPWVAADYTRENVRFHLALIALSGNEYLAAEAPIVRMTSQVFTPFALVEPQYAQRAVAQHERIIEAVIAGDGPTAERLARAHIRSTMERIASRQSSGQAQARA
ncbi:MAG: GntR family transcriptional regulator [Actinomycetota bacterium]|nr:GntR family transcriptional regulator [Actinomycetota bacterium]